MTLLQRLHLVAELRKQPGDFRLSSGSPDGSRRSAFFETAPFGVEIGGATSPLKISPRRTLSLAAVDFCDVEEDRLHLL